MKSVLRPRRLFHGRLFARRMGGRVDTRVQANARKGRVQRLADRVGSQTRRAGRALFWQETGGVRSSLPRERSQRGPFGEIGHRTSRGASSSKRAASRKAAGSLGSFTTIAVNDRSIRVLVTRGNKVLHWSSGDIPRGVVEDGAVIDKPRFERAIIAIVSSLYEGSRVRRRRTGVVISGRNTVQGRFVLLDHGEKRMDIAVKALAGERLSVTPSDVQMDWHAQALEPIVDDDEPVRSSSRDESDNDPGEPFEVYALGIFRNVLETNLRPIKETGMMPVAVAPKALALAAAVHEKMAMIVDVELDSVSAIVVRDGLPEVVRDMHFSEKLDDEQWGRALSAHVERAVEFHDILNPQATILAETPVFVTGRGPDVERVTAALVKRRYNVVQLPAGVDAPGDFPFDEMAANVGMAVLRGRKLWQRRKAQDVERPDLRFLPAAYEPRTLPVKPIAAGAAAAVFALGLAVGYGEVSDVRSRTGDAHAQLASLERRIDQRVSKLRQQVRIETQVSRVRVEAEAVLAASGAIRNNEAGFSDSLDSIISRVPAGVSLDEVDDDGLMVTVRATSRSYDLLLDFTRQMEAASEFTKTRVTSIGDKGPGSSPILALLGIDDGADPGEEIDFAPSLELEMTR